jgi:hypothetical protein
MNKEKKINQIMAFVRKAKFGRIIFRTYNNGKLVNEEITDPDPKLERDLVWDEYCTYDDENESDYDKQVTKVI